MHVPLTAHSTSCSATLGIFTALENSRGFLDILKITSLHIFPIRQTLTLLLSGNHPEKFPATSAFVFSCLTEQSSCNGSSFITAWFSINPAVPFIPSGTSPRSHSFSHSHLTLLCQSQLTPWKAMSWPRIRSTCSSQDILNQPNQCSVGFYTLPSKLSSN